MYSVHYSYTGEGACLEIKISPSADSSVLLLITSISYMLCWFYFQVTHTQIYIFLQDVFSQQ